MSLLGCFLVLPLLAQAQSGPLPADFSGESYRLCEFDSGGDS